VTSGANKPRKTAVTHDRLCEVIAYDPETGIFTWRGKPRLRRKLIGAPAGNRSAASRYIDIEIDQRRYQAHRLAWFYVHEEWPTGLIDHINGDKADNRIANLRIATKSLNAANAKRPATNTSGHKGVYLRPNGWRACIKINGRQRFLGHFKRKDDAIAAYTAAAEKAFAAFARIE
jgi:hypothetical protein